MGGSLRRFDRIRASGGWWILAGLAAVVLLARFYRLDMTWFFLDQLRDVSVASEIARGHAWPLRGPRIGWTEAYLGPLYYYLLAGAFVPTGSPQAGVALVAIANGAAVLLLYRFVRPLWGRGTALAAAALFAVFPLAVWSSRLVWHAGLVPLFTVLFMRALFAVGVRGSSVAVVPMVALLAVLTQLHLTTTVFAVNAAFALLVSRRAVRARHLAAGLGLGLALYAPYLAWEVSHGFADLRALAASSAGPPALAGLRAVLGNVLVLYRGAVDGFLTGWRPSPLAGAVSTLYWIEAALFAGGILICAGRIAGRAGSSLPPGRPRADAFLLLWLVLPILVLGTRPTAMWWYYFDLLYPSQFILAGIALATLPSLAPGHGRLAGGVAIALAAAIVLSQLGLLVAFQRRVARQGEIVLEVPRFSINATASPFGQLRSLPLGYRAGIIRTLVEAFGVDASGFSRRVHGIVLGPPEDSEYLVRYLAGRAGTAPAGGVAGLQYLVARGDRAPALLDAAGVERVGPYVVVAHRSVIEDAGWSYAVTSGAETEPRTGGWAPLALPARLDVDLAGKDTLRLHGALRLPGPGRRAVAVAAVAGWPPPARIDLRVGAADLQAIGRVVREAPLMLQRGSEWLMGVSWQSLATFQLDERTPAGGHAIEAGVVGAGRVLSIDVYETGPDIER